MFASVVSALSNSDGNPKTRQYVVSPKPDDETAMCVNIIGGRRTFGYLAPKPISKTTQLMIPTRSTVSKRSDDPTDLKSWIDQTVAVMNSRDMQGLAYTFEWAQIIDICTRCDVITPSIYHIVYLMLKIMSRCPRIPPGTVLYRGSDTPFNTNHRSNGFMMVSTDLRYTYGSYIGSYTVKPTDHIHGIWLDKDCGTSDYVYNKIIIGPSIYIDSVGVPTMRRNFGLIDTFLSSITRNETLFDIPVRVQVYPLELKQEDFGTYFIDNYNSDADERFRSVVESGCVLFDSGGGIKNCLFDSFHRSVFRDWNKSNYCGKLENLDIVSCENLYLAVLDGTAFKIRLSDEVKSDPKSAILPTQGDGYLYKIMINNTKVLYCNLDELIQMAFTGLTIVVMPIVEMTVNVRDYDDMYTN